MDVFRTEASDKEFRYISIHERLCDGRRKKQNKLIRYRVNDVQDEAKKEQ